MTTPIPSREDRAYRLDQLADSMLKQADKLTLAANACRLLDFMDEITAEHPNATAFPFLCWTEDGSRAVTMQVEHSPMTADGDPVDDFDITSMRGWDGIEFDHELVGVTREDWANEGGAFDFAAARERCDAALAGFAAI